MKTLPSQLASLQQWVCWRHVERNGQITKIPVQPNGDAAKANDPATWTTFAEAIAADEKIGFVFARKGGLFGVDLDECLVAGELAPWAAEIVERFPESYVETSPSGRGLKLFCGGADVEKGRSKKIGPKLPNADKAPGVEVYGQGRYFTVTGEAFQSNADIGDCSAGLAWLLGKYWPATTSAVPVESIAVSYHPQRPESTDVERRVLAYLDTCDPAVSGEAGSNRTFAVAGSLIHGFCLSPERAFTLMQSWNARCDPPWDEAGLRRKCEQAAAAPCTKPRGWLLNELRAMTAEVGDVDFSEFECGDPHIESVDRDGGPDSPLSAGEFPAAVFDRLPGVIGEVVAYNLSTTDAPQAQLALAGALALVSVVTGRKVKDYRNTRTNILAVGLAPSGAGKNHSRTINKKIIAKAGAAALLGNERIASHAGILAKLAEQPSTLMQVDEIGDLFATMKAGGAKTGHLKNIESTLKQIYSSAGDDTFTADAYANLGHVKAICQPHLVLYGSCTPSGFWSNLTADNVENGLLARMMVFEAAGYAAPTMADPEDADPPAAAVNWVRNWFAFQPGDGDLRCEYPTPTIARYDSDAREAFRLHKFQVQERRQREDERTAATWSRTPEKTAKLAMLFACSRVPDPAASPIVITLDDVERAKLVANWITRRIVHQVFETVADNAEEARKKKLLQLIGMGKRVSLSEVTNGTKTMNRNERNNALADLRSGGLIASEVVSTGGKPRTEFWRVRRE